jgi:hypothetical protein
LIWKLQSYATLTKPSYSLHKPLISRFGRFFHERVNISIFFFHSSSSWVYMNQKKVKRGQFGRKDENAIPRTISQEPPLFAAALRTCGDASRVRRRFAPAAALRACGGASRLRRRFAPVAALRAIEKHKKRQKVR